MKNPRFVKTALAPKDYPILKNSKGKNIAEIAVAGRSNVGKSSLLNHLFQTKGLVRTSSTPGKTQALNFFTLDEELVFVDLPGYGYAKVPMSVREQWGPMVQTYLEMRKQLKLMLFLFDIRRMPNEEDLRLLEWASFYEIGTILVFTKVDKVKRNLRAANTEKIIQAFGVANLHSVKYSVTKNIGRSILIAMIQDALDGETEG